MFLFILESIGTSELILIAIVALIVFGPRKLPQMAKTIGKTMSEFRNATNEFKSTWEREAALEDHEKKIFTLPETENRIVQAESLSALNSEPKLQEDLFPAPTIRELSATDIAERFHNESSFAESPKTEEKIIETTSSDKHDWL